MGTFGAAPWSQEMKDMFSERFAAGDSYPMIMAAMNRAFPGHPLSRSAICGHAFRNGYTKGRSARSVVKQVAKTEAKPTQKRMANSHQHTAKRIAAASKRAEQEAQAAELGLDLDAETSEGVTLMNQPCWHGTIANSIAIEALNDSSCRWPLQVDGSISLRFCHNKKGRGSYCYAHGSLAYTAARERTANHKPFYRASGANTGGLWGR
jgi:hypothetical protein